MTDDTLRTFTAEEQKIYERGYSAGFAEAVENQPYTPEGYRTMAVPDRYPYVMFGWGDIENDHPQTSTIILDGATPAQSGLHPHGLSLLQRRIAVMRLRYAADLIDPDKVWDL